MRTTSYHRKYSTSYRLITGSLKLKTIALIVVILYLLLAEGAVLTATQRDDSGIPPQIPELEWIPRSDWVDVKGIGAAGDGVTDDTVAIQKVLDSVKNGSNVYFPPGVYRITRTLQISGPLLGVTVIGHGRETTFIWDGDPGGVMFADDGVAYSRFVGLQFDGRNRASIGFHHDSHRRFETEVNHKYLAFRNFTNAGVLAEPEDKFALAETIDAAREHGEDAIAYLPTGIYVITSSLRITGQDYFVGGSGNMTRIVWRGAEGGTMITVHDPQNVVLEHIAAGVHDSGDMNNGIDILQTGSGKKSHMTYDGVFVYGMYQKQPFRKGLQFQKLGEEAVVVMPHVQGNIRFLDCGAATILANCSYEGSVVVEGMEGKRGGLLGFQTRLSTITTYSLYLKDNHSIIMSDFYVEQADDGYVFEGTPDTLPGRATIQGAKVHFTVPEDQPNRGTAMTIRNYSGGIFFGPNQLYVEPSRVRIRHTGEERLDLFLLANCFYKTTLDVQKSPAAKVFLLANQGVALSPDDQITSADETVDDNLAASDLERIAIALDDLRRLGELDLRINHQSVIGNQ